MEATNTWRSLAQFTEKLQMSNDGQICVVTKGNNLLVDHKSKDTEHSSTSVVQLNGTLGKLGLFIKVIPSEVNVSVTEVTNVFIAGSLNVAHEAALQPSDEADDLSLSLEGDGVVTDKGGNTVGEGVEGVSGVVNVSWKVDSGTGDDVTKEGKLSNTSVLDLDVTKTVETFLGDISGKHTEGIEESKWGLGTKLVYKLLKEEK